MSGSDGIPYIRPKAEVNIERVPGDNNWIEKLPPGLKGLPDYIRSLAHKLHTTQGWTISRSVAVAINMVRYMCVTGRAIHLKGRPKVSAAVRAAACEAIGKWEAMKAATSEEIEQEMLVELASRQKVSHAPWNPKEGDYTLEQWRRATLVHPARPSNSKSDYKYPVREPDGTLNINALKSAARLVNHGDISEEQRDALKRRLRALFRAVGLELPESLQTSEATNLEDMQLLLSSLAEEELDDVLFGEHLEAEAASRVALAAPATVNRATRREGRLWRKEVLRAGTYNYRGRKLTITPEDLKAMVDNFNASAVDYVPFQFVEKDNSHTDEPSKMRGLVRSLATSDDGRSLIADIELDEEASRLVEMNPRFGTSVQAHMAYKREGDGRYFGPTVLHVAGTHRPVIFGMGEWVKLSEEHNLLGVIDLSGEVVEEDEEAEEKDETGFIEKAVLTTLRYLGLADARHDASGEEEQSPTEKEEAEVAMSEEQIKEKEEKVPDRDKAEGVVGLSMEDVEARLAEERARWEKERDALLQREHEKEIEFYLSELKREGVPPAIVDKAAPILKAFRPDKEDGPVISLSENESVSLCDAMRGLLEEVKGLIDLSEEKGSARGADDESADEDIYRWLSGQL